MVQYNFIMGFTHMITLMQSEIYIILVIVKKSSPKNLSADSRPTVGRLSADRRLTGFARNIGYLLADSGLTVGRLLVMCR